MKITTIDARSHRQELEYPTDAALQSDTLRIEH